MIAHWFRRNCCSNQPVWCTGVHRAQTNLLQPIGSWQVGELMCLQLLATLHVPGRLLCVANVALADVVLHFSVHTGPTDDLARPAQASPTPTCPWCICLIIPARNIRGLLDSHPWRSVHLQLIVRPCPLGLQAGRPGGYLYRLRRNQPINSCTCVTHKSHIGIPVTSASCHSMNQASSVGSKVYPPNVQWLGRAMAPLQMYMLPT